MDPDRKSTVSSFYGARKSSYDALNYDQTSPSPAAEMGGRPRDDASSFFNPRGSMDMLVGRPNNAGYNRASYFHAGREEPLKGGRDEEEDAAEGAWDVYADFNNSGPKYSSAFGSQDPAGYQSLDAPTPKTDAGSTAAGGPVEMVTVPAMGAEWGKDELRDMTKAGRRAKKAEKRQQFWREITRGNRGGRWKRVTVFVCFGFIAVLAIALGICIPRVPSFSLSNSAPLGSATGNWSTTVPTLFSRAPANFSFPAVADLQVDTNANYLPLHFNSLSGSIYDLETGFLVATGTMNGFSMKAKSFVPLLLPLNFTYVAVNDTDTTWVTWYNACKSKGQYPGGSRPGLRFSLVLKMSISGLLRTLTTSTQVTNANCPIELPANSA